MKLISEFKAFIMKGNVLDLAVAFIIATAFKTIITSFVNDVLMPPIGLLLGNADFTELKIILQEGSPAVMSGEQVVAKEISEVALSYGVFINTIVDFIIIAFAIFMIIKAYSKMQKKKEEAPVAPPVPSNEEILLTEIRDILQSRQGLSGL